MLLWSDAVHIKSCCRDLSDVLLALPFISKDISQHYSSLFKTLVFPSYTSIAIHLTNGVQSDRYRKQL